MRIKIKFDSLLVEEFSCVIVSLTSTDAPGHGHVVAIVTVQSLVVVAGPHVAAVLVKLCSAHLAAAAPVRNSANTWGALEGLRRALAHLWAASSHLEERNLQEFTAGSSYTSFNH